MHRRRTRQTLLQTTLFALSALALAGCGAARADVQPAAHHAYTAAEVAAHQTESDCWLILHDQVYNVTTYLLVHPGGRDAILGNCGKDATAVFEKRPTNGRPHSDRARGMLQLFYVGDLKT